MSRIKETKDVAKVGKPVEGWEPMFMEVKKVRKTRDVAKDSIGLRGLDPAFVLSIKKEALDWGMSVTNYVVRILHDREMITRNW